MTDPAIVQPALGLIFILGLRHGLDPDHVAVIDNIVFRAADSRPRLAPWTGTLFAIGHSLSVAVVALTVSSLAGLLTLPAWLGVATDVAVIALLLLVGSLNLAALRRHSIYVPVGWRTRLIPGSLRTSTHPLAVIAIGAIFGMVFDTATQAAAWGAAAATGGGLGAAAGVAATFAGGMLLSDTADSQIVSRLLRAGGDYAVARRYRRAVGYLIVALSFGMAADGVLTMVGVSITLDDAAFTAIGVAAASSVIALLLRARLHRPLIHIGRPRR